MDQKWGSGSHCGGQKSPPKVVVCMVSADAGETTPPTGNFDQVWGPLKNS